MLKGALLVAVSVSVSSSEAVDPIARDVTVKLVDEGYAVSPTPPIDGEVRHFNVAFDWHEPGRLVVRVVDAQGPIAARAFEPGVNHADASWIFVRETLNRASRDVPLPPPSAEPDASSPTASPSRSPGPPTLSTSPDRPSRTDLGLAWAMLAPIIGGADVVASVASTGVMDPGVVGLSAGVNAAARLRFDSPLRVFLSAGYRHEKRRSTTAIDHVPLDVGVGWVPVEIDPVEVGVAITTDLQFVQAGSLSPALLAGIYARTEFDLAHWNEGGLGVFGEFRADVAIVREVFDDSFGEGLFTMGLSLGMQWRWF